MQRLSPLAGMRRLLNILVEGYATLNRRLWVLVIPIGLELYLWLGPRTSLRGLVEPLLALSRQVPSADPQSLAAVQEWAAQSSLAGLLAAPLTSALIPQLTGPARPRYTGAEWAPSSPWQWVAAGLVTMAVLLTFWCLYLVPLADLVRGSRESGPQMLRRVPTAVGRMAVYGALLLLGGAVLFMATGLVVTLFQLFSAALAALTMSLAGIGVIWGILLLFMVPAAILVSGVGPLRAVVYSVQVARSRLWSALGFLLLTTMIRMGTTTLWERLAGQPWGILLGIVANSYIVTGLAAAGLVFYREGLRDWLSRGHPA